MRLDCALFWHRPPPRYRAQQQLELLHLESDKHQHERNHCRGECGKDDVPPKDQWYQGEEREQHSARYPIKP